MPHRTASVQFAGKRFPENGRYAQLDRLKAQEGYTSENTRLVHHQCHIADQQEKGYA